MDNLIYAILAYAPDAKYTLIGSDYNGLVWEKGNTKPKPSEEELQALSAEALAGAEAANKDRVARREIKSRAFKAIRLLVNFAGSMTSAPQELKDLRNEFINLESDLQEED